MQGPRNDPGHTIQGEISFLKELNLIGETAEFSNNYHMAELEPELTASDSSLCSSPPRHTAISEEFGLHYKQQCEVKYKRLIFSIFVCLVQQENGIQVWKVPGERINE